MLLRSLSLLVALIVGSLPLCASAEVLLVELRSEQGASSSLVASGDLGAQLRADDPVATRKRVERRAEAIAQAREAFLGSLPAALLSSFRLAYQHVPLVVFDVDASGRTLLTGHPQVTAIHENHVRIPFTASSLSFLGGQPWFDEGFDGAGTAVAVLDTGIRYWNGHFGTCETPGAPGCRVLAFEGFATLAFGQGETDAEVVANASGHGTNVGGIVFDVAPGADLLSLGVFASYEPNPQTGFDGGVLANDADVVAALDWVIEHRDEFNIVSANMSLGSEVDPEQTGYCSGWVTGAYAATFANLRDAGVLPVVATGNEFVKTATSPPACIASALSVGAGYDDPAFGYTCGTGPVAPGAVVCFSNSNALVDLIAPGNDIDAGGLYGFGGTSMAAPHVAGIVALYEARYDTAPFWTVERMRADATPVEEIGPNQVYTHLSARIGNDSALVAFDTGAVLASSFRGRDIGDGSAGEPVEVSAEVSCEADLCSHDVVGLVYVDLAVDHLSNEDLVLELEGPDGTVVTHHVEREDFGLEHINSIVGAQHLPDLFEPLYGGPIEGQWTLRVSDETDGAQGTVHRAALLIDSARTELQGALEAPAIARPHEPFEVHVQLSNNGNATVTDGEVWLELLDGDEAVDRVALEMALPFAVEAALSETLTLSGPQGSYTIGLVADGVEPDLPPGLVAEPLAVEISYRTFAAFDVNPTVPIAAGDATLHITSQGLVQSARWDFGDGTSSNNIEPVHRWIRPGDYEVWLTVHGPDGESTTAQVVHVAASVPPPLDVQGGGCTAAARGTRSPLTLFWVLLALAALRRTVRRRLSAFRALSCLVALPFLACDGGEDPGDGGVDGASGGPWVSVLDPEDPSSGELLVWFLISDSSCDAELLYQVGDAPFEVATLAGEGTRTGGIEGERAFVWDSAKDIPGDEQQVRVQVQASCDGLVAPAITSSAFSVLNFLVTYPGAVLITEVSTAMDNVPADYQSPYVELRNTTDETVLLEHWILSVTSAEGGFFEHPLAGGVLHPQGRLVVSGPHSGVDGALELDEPLPWTLDAGGSVALFAPFERGSDFMRWGGSATTPPPDLAWTDDPPLPIPQTLTVIARSDESSDQNLASDFCVSAPSPSELSGGCLTPTEPSELLITELDSQGTNDQVEIWNASDRPIDVGGWVLLWDGDDLGDGLIALGHFILEPGMYLVLRDNGTAGRVRGSIMEMGENLNIDGLIPIALALQDPHGTIVDFLAAGGSRVRWVEWHEDEPTAMPGPATTLSRRAESEDTNSSDDFCLTRPNTGTQPSPCLAPMGIELVISEVMPGRPDWVEIYNPTAEPVDLAEVYVSYTSPYYGGSVGDYLLQGTLEPGAFVVVAEAPLPRVENQIPAGGYNIALAPEGDGSVALRDRHGFGIDFFMWGEPPGTPLWPDTWTGLGALTHEEDDEISIQRYPHDAEDTSHRDDLCWAHPTPGYENWYCEDES